MIDSLKADIHARIRAVKKTAGNLDIAQELELNLYPLLGKIVDEVGTLSEEVSDVVEAIDGGNFLDEESATAILTLLAIGEKLIETIRNVDFTDDFTKKKLLALSKDFESVAEGVEAIVEDATSEDVSDEDDEDDEDDEGSENPDEIETTEISNPTEPNEENNA